MCVFTAATMTAMGASAANASMMAMMANMSLVSTIGQVGMSMMAQQQQAKAAAANLRYQSQVAANNRQIAQWQAEDIRDRGDIAAKQHKLKVGGLKSRAVSVLTAQNWVVEEEGDDGADILADIAGLGKQDELTILANAEREAYKAEISAQNYGAQSGLLAAQAGQQSAALGMGTTLFSGAGSVAEKWYGYMRPA